MDKDFLSEKPYLHEFVYNRGFLITTADVSSLDDYPFYGNWEKERIDQFNFFIKNNQKLYIIEKDGKKFFLIGHAMDPIIMEASEQQILIELANASTKQAYYKALNRLTGIFIIGYIHNNTISFVGDAACMQSVFYGLHEDRIYISSHSQLIGDLCKLEIDPYVRELIHYKYYHLFGRMLPGDLTSYKNIKRLEPNFEISYHDGTFSKYRFYPTEKIEICKTDEEYNEIIANAYTILKNTMALIPLKWKKPAISLTGGCDSKTTISAVTNKKFYTTFSYISVAKEQPDAEAAHKIAQILEMEHRIDTIPDDDIAYPDLTYVREIIKNNCGNIGDINPNDVRKRIYYAQHSDLFDVEVKSWVSEVARAYYHKRFAKKKLPNKVSPRILTTMYKVFLNNRRLVRKTDKIFADYLNEYYGNGVFDLIAWHDLIFWEYRVAAWNGLVISGEHKYSFDITIPYNNRILLDLLLHTPLEKRIADIPHKDIQRLGNEFIYQTDIAVSNVEHTNKRAILEGLYFDLHSKIPF